MRSSEKRTVDTVALIKPHWRAQVALLITMPPYTRRIPAIVLAAALLLGSLVQPVLGAMVSTRDLAAANEDVIPTARVVALRQQVTRLLVDYGVAETRARQRAAALSHAELLLLQQESDGLPAGQGALALVGAVFIILLILDAVGVTNVFTGL